jgi:hypothetical protein
VKAVRNFFAGQLDFAAESGLMRAGDDLDEGGLARAVFAQQGVHFTGLQVKRHPLERAHRAKGLGEGG